MKLTNHEIKIIQLVADGLSDKLISKEIGLTQATVESYRVRLRRKLNVVNSPALVAYGFRNGIIN